VKWHYTTGQPINAAPVIDAGNIYFATQDGNVISLDGTGGLNWQHSVGTLVFGSPAIGSNGAVYVCNVSDNQLVSLDASGNENWRFTGADNAIAAPTVKRSGAGDTIYFGTTGNRMYCVDASGSEVWHYDATGVIYGSAAIGSDGAIYFGSQDGYLYALEPAGTLRWSFNNFAAIDGPLAIDSAGFIYFGDTDGYLDVVKPDGSDYAWLDALGDTFFDGGPAIGPNKSVYIVGANGAVYGFH